MLRLLYSPECVEGEFLELRVYGVLKKFVLLRQGPVPHPCTGTGQYRSRISYYAGGVRGVEV